jgi:hypothetical protein
VVTPPPSFSTTVGTGAAKSITYTDADGTTGVITLKGPGTATVQFNGTDLSQTTTRTGVDVVGAGQSVASIDTTGTSTASILTITTKGGTKAVNVAGLTTTSLKSFIAANVTLTGNLNATGSITTLTLAGAQGGTVNAASLGNVVVSGDFSDGLTLTNAGVSLNRFTAASVNSGTWNISGSVNSLDVSRQNLGATISAASITVLQVKGSLSTPGLDLTSTGDDINTLTVTGSISASLINASGDIGSITAQSLVSSEIYAGVGNLTTGQNLPDSVTDFTAIDSIKSLRLKITPGGNSFSNSAIAAASLGSLSLGTVPTGAPGIAAEDITSLTGVSNKRFSIRDITSSTDLASIFTKDGISIATADLLDIL